MIAPRVNERTSAYCTGCDAHLAAALNDLGLCTCLATDTTRAGKGAAAARPASSSEPNDLSDFPLFASVTPQDAAILREAVRVCRFRAGTRIFEEGEVVRGFYLVKRGAVKIFRLSAAGQEMVLSIATPGQSFAEAAVFQGTRYPASTECIEDCELLFVERDALLRQVRRDAELALRMLAGVAARLSQMVSLIEGLTLRDARSRICRYLVEQLPVDGRACEKSCRTVDIRLPVRQVLLARWLGLTGETFSRTLKVLRDEGILHEATRGKIVVRDVARLRQAAGEDAAELR